MVPTHPPLNSSSTPGHLNNSSLTFLSPPPNNTYYTDEEEQDPGISDYQNIVLACFLTLLPLIFGLIWYFGLRPCWLRCQRSVEPSELAKSLDKDTSDRNKSSHALLNDQVSQMKTSESEFSVVDIVEETGNQTSKLAANGSVITMTMKNNHLIVETEEIPEESGVEEPVAGETAPLEEVLPPTDSAALVHVSSPKEYTELQGVNTGQSTSDLSSASDASTTNRGYRYGNQEEYRVEEEDWCVRREAAEGAALPRASVDLGAPAPGTESPAFLPAAPAEPAAS